ncbi:MAG: Hsp70 family protein [Desulfobacterales bacterium]
MDFNDKRYIVGIDLGTTNSAVSFVDLANAEEGREKVEIFHIPQLTGKSEIGRLNVLPSFYYIPGTYDIAEAAIRLPWPTRSNNFAGLYAREQGANVPSRLVSSAKSWLCHRGVDRKARILPWGADDDVKKVSPVEAGAAYLEHIRKAWNSYQEDEDGFLENQEVIITVPASFDEVARDLTVESAKLAGIPEFTLLEEPLAAFYSWLMQHDADWQNVVKPDDLILICDVGGGTTDFTLITLKEEEGVSGFERIAVGDHLILGGDNMDVALAGLLEKRLSSTLSPDRWKALCNQSRQAKEDILEGCSDAKRITLVGKGRQLIAGTLAVDLHRQDVEHCVLETFFPFVREDDPIHATDIDKKTEAFGLPYEPIQAVTRHISFFLQRHQADIRHVLKKEKNIPDLVLFNGGVLKPGIIRDRIIHAISRWDRLEGGREPRVMENPFPDLAVAMGASYYGLVKTGRGVRVGSGSARGYYMGVTKSAEGPDHQRHAICLVERGLQEGTKVTLENTYDVLANQPVEFDMYSSSFRAGDAVGDIIPVDDSLSPLPSIKTVIQFGQKSRKTKIPVFIEAEYTEVGTLSLWCRSLVSPHRWQLQFDLRNVDRTLEIRDETVYEETTVNEVQETVRAAFAARSTIHPLDSLMKDIAGIIGRKKDDWPLGLIRKIADILVENTQWRKAGPDHERRWLNLAGFCLRPGFGEGFDDHRMKKVWRIYGKGPLRANQPQVRTEWWVFWRRIAGGLNAGQQKQIMQDAAHWVMPKKGKVKKLTPHERIEIWMAAAAMERTVVDEKIKWGRYFLSELKPGKYMMQQLWSLSRLGARELLYGSADRVVPVNEIGLWIRRLMSLDWKNDIPVVNVVAQMARKTGDRTRDLDDRQRDDILNWAASHGAPESVLKIVKKPVPIEKGEKNVLFGDALPSGLVLREGRDY